MDATLTVEPPPRRRAISPASRVRSDAYRFEPLSWANLGVWLKTARRCWYAPVTAVDESWLRQHLEEGRAQGHVIIYRGPTPVALLPGVLGVGAMRWLRLRRLAADGGGVLLADAETAWAGRVRDFAWRQVVSSYYRRVLRIDYLELSLPPQIVLKQPHEAHNLIPFEQSVTAINTLLYAELSEDLLAHLRPATRYEVRKGLERLNDESVQLLRGRDEALVGHLETLEQQKARTLRCPPLPRAHFVRVLGTPFYHALVAVAEGQPQAAVIYTAHADVATFHFNASTPQAKRDLLNKALLYAAMRESMERGARYFVLGEGREVSVVHPNVSSVAWFKRSFSTHERVTYRFIRPLSAAGLLATVYARLVTPSHAQPSAD